MFYVFFSHQFLVSNHSCVQILLDYIIIFLMNTYPKLYFICFPYHYFLKYFGILTVFLSHVEDKTNLYSFPIAALTSYHKLNGLNNTSVLFYSSVGQKSDMLYLTSHDSDAQSSLASVFGLKCLNDYLG